MSTTSMRSPAHTANIASQEEFARIQFHLEALARLAAAAQEVGGAYQPLPGTEHAVAFTHFDSPSSEDNTVTILLTKENMDRLPSQALVRINSLIDGGTVDRTYIGQSSLALSPNPMGSVRILPWS